MPIPGGINPGGIHGQRDRRGRGGGFDGPRSKKSFASHVIPFRGALAKNSRREKNAESERKGPDRLSQFSPAHFNVVWTSGTVRNREDNWQEGFAGG